MRHPEGPDSSRAVSNLLRAGMAVLTGMVEAAAGGVGCATAPMTPADRAAEGGEVVYRCRETGEKVTQRLLEAEAELGYEGCGRAKSIVDEVQDIIDHADDACGPREIGYMQSDLNRFRQDKMQPGCTGDMPADKAAEKVREARTCGDALARASAREGAAFLFAKDGKCDDAIEEFRRAVEMLNTDGQACEPSTLNAHRIILQETYRQNIAPRCAKK